MDIMQAGTLVGINRTVHSGAVKEVRVAPDGSSVTYLVAFTGHEGEAHERWFEAAELTKG